MGSISQEELIKKSVIASSKITEPCTIRFFDQSYDEFLNGDNKERRQAFTLEGRRGERVLKNISEHTQQENDELIEELNEIATKFINQQIISHYPETEATVREINFKNVLEPARIIKIDDHRLGSYQMSDHCFNLYPSRICFLEPHKQACGGRNSDLYKDLKELVEQECSNGPGCYYRYYFPESGKAGRVALPRSVEYFFTKLIPSCTHEKDKTGFLQILHSRYFSFAEESGKKKAQTVYRVRNQCIVCTLLAMTKELTKGGGIDRPCMQLFNEEDENLFLLKTENMEDMGVVETFRPNHNEPIVNVHGQKKVMLTDKSKMFSRYMMCEEDGFFFPVMLDSSKKVKPSNLPTKRGKKRPGRRPGYKLDKTKRKASTTTPEFEQATTSKRKASTTTPVFEKATTSKVIKIEEDGSSIF